MQRFTRISLLVSLFAATPAISCGFHNYAPQPTIVEHMLGSSAVVLARQDASSPFSYEITEVLLGDAPTTRIPFLVDSVTRQKLRREDISVLFGFDGNSGTWQRLATINPAMRPALEDIVRQIPEWRMGGDADRAETFSWLLDHPEPAIRRLALQELDRVDYSVLRSMWLTLDARALMAGNSGSSQRLLEPIRVLLIGLSRDPSAVPYLRSGITGNRSGFGPQMGAYATAWIELEGVQAVENLTRVHLADPRVSQSARELIIEALAIHSSYGDPDVVEAVRGELAAAIRRDPGLSIPAARQFLARYDWSLRDVIAEVGDGIVPEVEEDGLLIRHYLLMSGAETADPLGVQN